MLWQTQVDLPDLRSGGPLPRRADAVVVGGGYAGLAAARTLAAAGRDVVVLEAAPIGTGAHARNGGMVIPELKAGPATLEARYGPVGRRMYDEVNEAFDFVEALIADHDIACDYARTGQLYLAHTPRLVPYLRKLAAEHAEGLGEPVRFVPRDELGAEIGSDAFHGGVVYERTGGLHPARFHAGLLDLALAAGATVVERTAARRLEATAWGHRVHTDRGTIDCTDVVLATNASADGLVPELARRVLPIGSFIIATEPLPAEVADAVSPRRRMFVDTKNLLFYWRLAPDGRLVFGGRRSLAASTVPQAAAFLTEALHRIHPQVAEVPITHRWGGEVAITLDRLPHVGRIRGAWYATGCNGSGVALNTWLGHRVARTILGEEPAPSFAELPHRPIPLHRFRRAYLPAVGTWFRFQDRP